MKLSRRSGIAPAQPAPFDHMLGSLWKAALLTLVAAFIVQALGGSGRLVQTAQMHVDAGSSGKSQTLAQFELHNRGNVVVQTVAPLDNNWLELDLTLVDESANRAYEAQQAIERYSGVEDGEAWSDGGTECETYFSALSPGNYRLIAEPAPGQVPPGGIDVALQIHENVPAWGNFWIAMLLVFALPVYALFYRWHFETRRWANSDHAPVIFRTGESDD